MIHKLKNTTSIGLSGITGHVTPNESAIVRRVIRSANRVWRKTPAAAVTVNFISAPAIQRLNQQYRRINRPTTTLSFIYQGNGRPGDPWIGEIMFCRSAITRWAEESELTYPQALTELAAHSLLHILGYNHQTDAQERTMERWANRIIKSKL